jgi:hypothetical protein
VVHNVQSFTSVHINSDFRILISCLHLGLSEG